MFAEIALLSSGLDILQNVLSIRILMLCKLWLVKESDVVMN